MTTTGFITSSSVRRRFEDDKHDLRQPQCVEAARSPVGTCALPRDLGDASGVGGETVAVAMPCDTDLEGSLTPLPLPLLANENVENVVAGLLVALCDISTELELEKALGGGASVAEEVPMALISASLRHGGRLIVDW